MELRRFLVKSGYGDQKILDLLARNKISIILAGKTERIAISSPEMIEEINLGYGDKVLADEKLHRYTAKMTSEALENKQISSISKFIGILALGIIAAIIIPKQFKNWSEAHNQRQEQARAISELAKAKDLATNMRREQEIKQEAAQRLSQAKQEELRAEQEEVRRQNVPMGTFVPVKDDRSIAVTDAKLYESLQTGNSFSSPISGEGGLILVVYMTLSNTGKESGDMTWTSFTVEDTNGFEYSELQGQSFDLSMWRDAMGLGDSDDQLFPGQNKQIAKVYRVKRDSPGMKLAVGNYKFLLY